MMVLLMVIKKFMMIILIFRTIRVTVVIVVIVLSNHNVRCIVLLLRIVNQSDPLYIRKSLKQAYEVSFRTAWHWRAGRAP